jgi:hypothetical protein
MIRVCDAPTAGELSFHTEHLRDRLNDYAPQTGLFIQRIRLTVGRVKK